jgi:hypothetical protein
MRCGDRESRSAGTESRRANDQDPPGLRWERPTVGFLLERGASESRSADGEGPGRDPSAEKRQGPTQVAAAKPDVGPSVHWETDTLSLKAVKDRGDDS